MIQTLSKNWLLLALCSILDAAASVIYLAMQYTDGPLSVHARGGGIELLGELTLAAGVCMIAAGVWRSATGKCWHLVVNGLALSALGVIYYGFVPSRFRVSFNTIALLIILMAISFGILELVNAQRQRRQRHIADGWFSGLAGMASVGFALPFLGLALRWIPMGPRSRADLGWLGAYFGFSAICMVVLALRLHSQGEASPTLGSPIHAR